jgi:hypothetical protein
MHADEFLKSNPVENRILHQVKLSEVKTDEATPAETNTPDGLMLLGPVSFIVSWTVLFLMLSKIGTAARNEILVSIKRLHQVPCRNCQFFSNNTYLKCAVNPSTVLTEQAFNCSDYLPGNSKFLD